MAQFTREQIKEELTKLEVEFNTRDKSENLLAMLNTMTGEEHTFLAAAPTQPVQTPPNVTTSASLGAGSTPPVVTEETTTTPPVEKDPNETIRCIIHSNDRENEEKMFEGHLNGKAIRVKLGEEIDFPVRFKSLIQGAVVETKIPLLDEDGTPNGKYKEVRRPRYIIEAV